ncbi:transposase [Solidesulfovibrio sp.]
MEDRITAKQIAQALGVSERAAQSRAGKESWPFEEVACRGGKRRVYPLVSLPSDVREALGRVAASEAAAAGRREGLKVKLGDDIAARASHAARQAGLARLVCLGDTARSRAEARASLVAALETYLRATGKPPTTGRTLFAEAYNAGQIEVEAFVRELIPDTCANSLHNWQKKLHVAGIASLAGNYGHRRGSGLASRPEIVDFVRAMLADHPHCTCKHIRRGMIARFGEGATPSMRSLQRFVETWTQENESILLKIGNPDAWKSKFQSAAGSASAEVVRLNQLWEIDSTKGDVMLADGKRHNVVAIIDVYSRRIVYHVSRSSSAQAVAACLRKALLTWGVPETLVTDNGSDYVSRHIKDALVGLGVEQRIAPPFTPEAKPHIERSFGTFCRDIMELLVGYIGHDVAGRKDIEARKSFAQRLGTAGESVTVDMTPQDFQAFCDKWSNDIYAHDPHEGLGGKSPWQVAADWRLPVSKVDPRALDVLLSAPADGDSWRVVRKKGLKIDGRWHIHAELGPIIGQRVKVLLDEADVGAVYVFAETSGGPMEFLCRAVDPETTGISRQEIAAAAKAMQRKAVAEETAALKKNAKRMGTKAVAREILHDAATKSGKLTVFPQPSTAHETPMLKEAAIAARVGDAPTPREPSAADLAGRAALAADMAKQKAPVTQLPETAKQRYVRWLGVDAALQAGASVSEKDRKWWAGYRQTPEFSAQAKLREMFPEMAASAR